MGLTVAESKKGISTSFGLTEVAALRNWELTKQDWLLRMEEMLQKLASRPGIKSFIPVAFLGMRLWPADKLGFTKTAIQAKPDSSLLGVQMWTSSVWPKRPAPPRFGRKLTDTQKDESYSCPQCLAPKKRFAKYDVSTGKAIGGGLPPIGVIIGLIAGLGAVGALLVYGLQ
ncbi:unnamed protein product [Rhodiola kirilowii]